MTHRKSRKSRLGDCKEDFMPWLPGSGQTIPHRGRTCSRRLKSGFCSVLTHTAQCSHCSNCAHTVCRVPTSPILGPASRCRHFVSRCPTALLLRYRVWHIVFHHMVISLHIVSTLMTHSTPSQIAKWLRITHADLTLYWADFWHMRKKTKIGRLSFLVSRARLDWEAVPWKMINFVQAWHSVHTK